METAEVYFRKLKSVSNHILGRISREYPQAALFNFSHTHHIFFCVGRWGRQIEECTVYLRLGSSTLIISLQRLNLQPAGALWENHRQQLVSRQQGTSG